MGKRQKELEYKDGLIDSGVRELHFANMEIAILLSLLNEIKAITNDNLVKGIVDNGIERHHLDKMCHTRTLFPNPQGIGKGDMKTEKKVSM